MSLTFTFNDGERDHRYTVKDYDAVTLGDWKQWAPIEAPADELDAMDATYARVVAVTGIPSKYLDRMPMDEVQKIINAVDDLFIKAQAGSDAFNAALETDTGYVPPETITIGDTTYAVPYDLEKETVAGQWSDWYRWEAPQHEADLLAETLGFMLVKSGEKYSGAPKAKVEAMMECPMCQAFDLCAFFFAKSERFRSATNRRRGSFHTLMNALLEKALRLSPADTEALISSTMPPK